MIAAKHALPSFSFQAIRGEDEFWDESIRATADACEPGIKCRSEGLSRKHPLGSTNSEQELIYQR